MTVDDWKDLLPKKSSIIIWGIIGLVCLTLQGCYTQLSMFHPDEKTEEFYPYSVARVRPNLSLYARDGAGQSLGMAYQLMYSRFYRYYGNTYSYWNPYYYGGYYNDYLYRTPQGNITVYIPMVKEKKVRTFTTRNDDSDRQYTTNLRVTRSNNSSSTSNSSSSSSSNSNSRTRVTRRN